MQLSDIAIRCFTSLICAGLLVCLAGAPAASLKLGISSDGRYFTLDGKPTYLNGISYYAGTSVSSSKDLISDMDDISADKFNWIRVWTHWDADENLTVTTPDGKVREPYMSRLKTIISECDKRGIIVDVTMHRGKHPVPSSREEHLACARTLAEQLKPYRNVYIDVGNERDIGDARHVPMCEVGELITEIKKIDPGRICTASGVPGSLDEMRQYIVVGKCDFIAPHLCRDEGCPAKTAGSVLQMIAWMNEIGTRIPVHLQEPFRRDYTGYQPTVEDYYRDNSGGKIAGAAGWCLHNGSSRNNSDRRPYRSFLMNANEGRLYAQLDDVELEVCHTIDDQIGGTAVGSRRYQAEYEEHLEHEVGHRDGLAWAAHPTRDKAGVIGSGPNSGDIESGKWRATWRLMLTEDNKDHAEVVTLYVRAGNQELAKRVIRPEMFRGSGKWREFSVEFVCADGVKSGFGAYWHGGLGVKLDHVTLASR